MPVTDVGMQYILGVALNSTTQITTWYIGIVDNSGWTAFNFGDTMASHSTWSEVSGSTLVESTRVAWTPTAGGSSPSWTQTNTSTDNHTITGAGFTAKGVFITSVNTKGGTTGTLLATAAFAGGTQLVNAGDTIKMTYTMTGTAS
jgi:hypothetical protein